MVPNEWRFTRLGSVAELQRGFDLPSAQRQPGSVPIISSAGATGLHDQFRALKPGVVTGRYGSIGNVFNIEENYWPLNTTLWVKNFHGNCEKFVYYLLSNFDFSKFSDKTGVPGVNRNDLHSVKVAVPPIDEQKVISQLLSTWDDAITANEDLLANSRLRKKALMQQLLTGKKRLPGFEDVWKEGFLGDLCDFKGGIGFNEAIQGSKSGEYPFIKVSDMNLVGNEKYIHHSNNWVTSDTAAKIKARPFPSGAVVFAKVGAALLLNRRRILVQPTIIDNNMMVATPKENTTTEFVYQVMLDIDFAGMVQDGALPSINQGHLAKFKIHFPILNEQIAIAQVLTIADEEIEALEQRTNNLKLQKKALMQQLLTGKKRVKVDPVAA